MWRDVTGQSVFSFYLVSDNLIIRVWLRKLSDIRERNFWRAVRNGIWCLFLIYLVYSNFHKFLDVLTLNKRMINMFSCFIKLMFFHMKFSDEISIFCLFCKIFKNYSPRIASKATSQALCIDDFDFDFDFDNR